ncbi:MAG: LPS export ABC transporter ATP-binding protein [Pseudomonadales bacterium]|jgi:lipopolysaccharide export system ATP-binding protein|nr:LPS export ABC transporter ATP-binding protein [Pseudomonadales bacterium]MDP4641333.1 LPS export ABC transporter ATP-binding protein [Pseudomonadales bacterium]MDP4766331.1 LPS export ABC transporter ATP-binding protein [Pseudomonadales bacterium]MDP4876419.1 LPS export ABC transporter ATP-binding protein [Pseudomonadales bacterium]MDP4912452.1 LPS export ABC transporter ATP-binding protein [Pseudomonadales bacterium]
MHVLRATSLAKSYRGKAVVKDVTLSVQSGQVVGLLGPNGAGKTTCFYMIVGSISGDAGKILFDETDLTAMPMHQRARTGIGYLPQEASIFRRLTVAENILAILETRKGLSHAQRLESLESLLAEFHIGHIRNNMGMALSGGERRRVEIARALATEPSFILLDEPFAGVDPISVNDIKGIIQQLSERGIGVLITDHNVRETLDICEKAYIVSEGRIIAEGPTQAILADEQVRRVYLGDNFRM